MSDKWNQSNFHPERGREKVRRDTWTTWLLGEKKKFHRIPIDLKISDFSRRITIEIAKLWAATQEGGEKVPIEIDGQRRSWENERKIENCRKRKKQTSEGKVLTHK